MVQQITKQGHISGRIGKGIGQGLAEQVPKEIDRYRLSQGLQQFEKDSGNLNPLQQLTRLSAIPGITPQMIQSFGELAKQQAQAGSLRRGVPSQNGNQPQQPQADKNKFPSRQNLGGEKQPAKSITTTEPVQNTINPYIPKTYDQIIDRASELYEQNPALYKNDPNNAIQAATQEDSQNQAINQSQQNKRKTQQDVQTRIQQELKTQADNAGVKIPDNVYSGIEDEAIDAVNSGKMTELEAAKHYKKKLDAISRKYEAVKTVGKGTLITRFPKENKDALRSIRNDFKQRDDLENFADTMVSENGLTFPKSRYMAYPISEIKELNNTIKSLPELELDTTLFEDAVHPDKARKATLGAAPKIAQEMGQKGSPLAIAEELKSKHYDPYAWMEYLDKNREKLKLAEWQARELDKPRSFVPSIDDLWMFFFSGLDKIVEQ